MPETLKQARAKMFDPHNRHDARPVTPEHVGKHITTLTPNDCGMYVPCLSKLVKLTACKAQIDLYAQGTDVRTFSFEAVFHQEHLTIYDMTDSELSDALKAQFPKSEAIIDRLDRDRLINATFSKALPLRVNDDGTCHWPCDASQPMHDTCSDAVELKTVGEINTAIREKRVVYYNSYHWTTGKRRADKARTHKGQFQVHGRAGWCDVRPSVCVYYDPEA